MEEEKDELCPLGVILISKGSSAELVLFMYPFSAAVVDAART
jgi:hypothetical protein